MTTDNPIRTDELEGWLKEQAADPEKFRNSIQNGDFQKKIGQYAAATNETQKELLNQVREQTQATFLEMLKDNKATATNKVDLNPYGGSSIPKYAALENKKAVGAGLNGKFDNLGTFLQDTWYLNQKSPSTESAERLRLLNAYQEKVPSDGGFLVPEEFRAELLRLSLETAVVRPRARVVPMGSLSLRFPAVDSTTNVGSIYGGIQAYWTEEGAPLVESSGTFASVKLEAHKLTALASVTNELVRDAAGGFAMYIEQMFPEALAWYEDLAFLAGNGVGMPMGVLSAGNKAIVSVAKETSQAAATILWNNIVKMYARMLPASLNRAVWLVTPDAFPALATMQTVVKDVAGTQNVGGAAVWMPDAHGAPQLTLLGRPVIMTEKAPGLLGTQGDITFVDFGMYLIGDRQQMTVDSSAHSQFRNDKTEYRIISRVDGKPWLQSAITPANGGPAMSPFVQLATRS